VTAVILWYTEESWKRRSTELDDRTKCLDDGARETRRNGFFEPQGSWEHTRSTIPGAWYRQLPSCCKSGWLGRRYSSGEQKKDAGFEYLGGPTTLINVTSTALWTIEVLEVTVSHQVAEWAMLLYLKKKFAIEAWYHAYIRSTEYLNGVTLTVSDSTRLFGAYTKNMDLNLNACACQRCVSSS
jgi:hypothetical protein